MIIAGTWIGGNITVNIDGLSPGIHVCICTVYDLDDHSVSNAIMVTVTGTVTETTTTTIIPSSSSTTSSSSTASSSSTTTTQSRSTPGFELLSFILSFFVMGAFIITRKRQNRG